MSSSYRVALTAESVHPDGQSVFGDLALGRLEQAGIEWQVLPRATDPIEPDDLKDFDAVWSLSHAHFDEELLDRLPRLRHIARFGAGFDTIDLDACTRNGVAVTNTPDGVRRPLALAALTLTLTLAQRLIDKQRVARDGDWSRRESARGHGVHNRVLGIVGYGNVGRDLAGLAQGVGFRVVANNRHGHDTEPGGPIVQFLGLDELLASADYVVITASLNEESFHLIGRERLALMKPDAYLINVARGAIVDEDALVAALTAHRIAGAALDVFEREPLPAAHPLQELDSVILTPHSLNWTDEFVDWVSTSAIGAIIDVARWAAPKYLLNPAVLSSEAWRSRSTPRILSR